MVQTVLMVAEKPSIAESIAHHLSNGRTAKHSRALPVFEYDGYFQGAPAHFRVTSTTGHIFSCDFTPQYQSWDRTDEESLFGAPVVWREESGRVSRHLEHEAKGCATLVLWLDCDREGENICFEVMQVVSRSIHDIRCIWRAKFSAITREAITEAFVNLGKPNKNLSDAVSCRQELDLKVGVVFTRYQTKYFQGKYGNLDASVVSYGPCQTPTLAFCVQRHDEILNFKPENYWKLVPTCNRYGSPITFEWARGRVFDELIARLLHQRVSRSKVAKVVDVSVGADTRARPTALNTVELMKIASKFLGIGPHHAMQIAENLYISGYISYPRTESTAYPVSFDLKAALATQQGHPVWGEYVQELLKGRYTRPKAGKDAGDHPPITPMRAATAGELSSDSWRLYEYITRHFIATVSPDCKLSRTKLVLELSGELFTFTGKVVVDPGFTTILAHLAVKDDKVPTNIEVGSDFPINDVRLQAGQTQAPGYLTEADLIGLMEKNGIGTDASISQHVNNIVERGYCAVKPGRVMEPTKLGVVLIHGIKSIDPELVLPLVRSKVEEYVTCIAEGQARLDEVLSSVLDLFFGKFRYFKENIERFDALMGASFSPLTSSGKPITRCGNCMRYLKHLEARPQRLYCAYCEVTYALPQGGTIKQYSNYKCPLDNFELVICHVEGGKSFPICPNCYNNPPFPDARVQGGRQLMACDECKHPTCYHSLATNYVADCVDPRCDGCMAFVPRTSGKWKICCNHCTMMILLPPTAQRVYVSSEECPECGAMMVDLQFPEGKSPLPNRKDRIVSCVFCDPALSNNVSEVRGKLGNFSRRGGGGKGRGRGGRGRGRGRGYRN
ncbi:DNA topoisomerase III, putative [Trypanosoma brucei gambiense DAL972]|uniref:DNA topoisomerase n=4 Tax=Trypanosoma brucei TaxID=5691 RepID=Q384B1_TRYB2|nr:DNA topoisomerase III, putative [Trypanosoma brucei gambiense DAL972]XP_828982.1 DNA topoisomerase III, putative [Trypanosoma brucei brucei TREU927]ABP01567.1 topoisomerase IIIbeta [Trypanosoma brucei brucei]RHW68032.1 DNA topoisomerase III [Trypanosoma brucei equiperdum]EAN79870.1 DNA topoisomerase III, putative [Trypanosoma brucei brucei TREU927]CBH17906.1 DNA topoisomerase III, putative [Trypanosoma brucei gambiense DAL972]|eukprot:XP_011780170.1 DNA topoisomerase III, putative [Trypanosoma brucei gambiense DAL972]